jgi:hypothetical protein
MVSSLYYPVPEDIEPPVTEPTSLNSASIVPADAWAFLSVQRLKGGWGYITSYMEENWEAVAPLLDIDPETVSFEDFMAVIDAELGFSLDEDVFGWMTGECAFAMVPFLSLDEEPFPNFVIMFEVENPVEVETHLSNIITALGGTTSSTTIEEQPATLIHIPGMEPLQPGYLFLNVDGSDYLVIGLTEDALAAAVNAYNNPAQSLKEAENFEGILSMLLGEKIGMAYLDIGRLVDAMVSLMTEEEAAEFEEYAPFIEPMLAMGCSSSYIEEKHAALMTFALLVVTPEWNPWAYDEDGSGYIEIGELLDAISDYIGGGIDISKLLEIISLYISHTPK